MKTIGLVDDIMEGEFRMADLVWAFSHTCGRHVCLQFDCFFFINTSTTNLVACGC